MFVPFLGPDDLFEGVERICVSLLSGSVVLGDRGHSVGPFTPSVRLPGDGTWAVLDLRGGLLYCAHDAFEAARAFARLESGLLEDEDVYPRMEPTDAEHVARRLYDHWFERYRFVPPFDRPEPPNPYEKESPP